MSELFFLSLIQGITEFLPVSSSAHLILFSKYLNFTRTNLTIDVSLHLGSLLAIIFYFKNEFNSFLKKKNLLKKIILTSLPTTIVGFFLIKYNYIELFRNYKVIGWSTILFGLLLYFSDLKKTDRNIKKNFNLKNVLIISLFQILSLVPGVSRSGIIITAARFLNFNRVDSAKISFLTSIPILIIASTYNLQKIILEKNFQVSIDNIISIILSFIFSYFTIKVFIKYLKKSNLFFFIIYRVVLGILILLYVYF